MKWPLRADGANNASVSGASVTNAARNSGVDLVGSLLDAWAYRGADAGGPRPQRGHGANRRFQNPRLRPPPAGVGDRDHAGIGVCEKDRRAIGGQNAKNEPRRSGHERVDLRPRRPDRPRPIDDLDPRGVDLTGGHQRAAAETEPIGRARPVNGDAFGIIHRAEAAVETIVGRRD